MALQHELTSSQLQASMRKMAGDFDTTLTNLQKTQAEKQLLHQQVSSQRAELESVREEVKEREKVWEEERADAQRRAEEFAELEESVSQLRGVSKGGWWVWLVAMDTTLQELEKLSTHTSEEQSKHNSSLISQVSWGCP